MKAFSSGQRAFQRAIAMLAVLWGISVNPLLATEKTFSLNGATLTLEEATSDVGVVFTALRFNRAARVWNVEASLTNRSAQPWQGPFVVLVESFPGTSGVLQPDGQDTNSQAFFDLSGKVTSSELSARETSLPRTLTLGFQAGAAPQLNVRIFARRSPLFAGLSLVRTLDDAGLPLPAVTVDGADAGAQTDDTFGLATLTPTNATRALRFSAPAFLPVWRIATVSSNGVSIIPHPRLTRRGTNAVTLTPIAGGRVRRGTPPVEVDFTPGAFSQDTTARLTPLTGQTLPLFLPPGWSPLAAFWLELSSEPALPGSASLTPSGPIFTGETVALVRLNTNSPAWEVLQLLRGNGTNAVTVAVPGGGAFALVVADAAPIAPPPPVVGGSLSPSTTPLPDPANLRAGGTVTPSSSPASQLPELVTDTAEVVVTNLAGNLPSGTLLRGEVSERYLLRDGTRRFPARFDNFVVGYQRPGDTQLDTVRAEFPIRPLLLFGAEELQEAIVRMDLFAPGAFSGGILGTNGGQLTSDGLRVLAGTGDLRTSQAVPLQRLAVTNFTELAGSNATVVAAFEIGVNGVTAGRRLILQLEGLTTNASFVLARVLAREGLYGLEPRERLHSDAGGSLRSDEPANGEKLPGLNGAGQYVLLSINPAQGLVSGIAQNRSGQPAGGLPVRITGQPWLTFSANDGAFQLLAPAGAATVTVSDLVSGDRGAQSVTVPNPQTPVNTTLAAAASRPQVLRVTPANAARDVSRVTAVVVEFDQAINPATLAAGGLALLNASNAPVASSLALNLRGTVATLLPVDPLAANTQFTIRLSTNVAGLTGNKLAGANQFTFTTESDALNRLAGQFTIFEPTNGLAPVAGSAGTADPESPVILVNETTGFTSTVLSKPDGSFTNSLPADEDDLLSAVLVNQNGTRTTLPASRQIFRDGSVGLFQSGGILEAQSAAGPVQVIVEPGAIANKSKFSLQALGLAELLALVQGTPPTEGQALGAFRLEMTGGELREPARVRMPVAAAALQIPVGRQPEELAFVLTRTAVVDGIPVYEAVDSMRYVGGRVESEGTLGGLRDGSPASSAALTSQQPARVAQKEVRPAFAVGAFLGIFVIQQLTEVLKEQYSIVSGKVGAQELGPVAGAAVFVASEETASRLTPGDRVAFTKANGFYAVPGGRAVTGRNTITGIATSQRFPGDVAVGRTTFIPGNPRIPLDLFFRAGTTDPAAAGDSQPPTVSVSHSPASPPTNQTATLRIFGNDDKRLTLLNAVVTEVKPLSPAIPVNLSDVTFVEDPGAQVSLQTIRRSYGVKAAKPLEAHFTVTAKDAASHTNTVAYSMVFGGPQPPTNPPLDPNDKTGPFVTRSVPVQNAEGVLPGQVIQLRFSEPIFGLPSLYTADQVFQLSPPAGPAVAKVGDDRLSVELTYYALQPGTDYSLTVNPLPFDVNGNRFDQNPYNNPPANPDSAADAFLLKFRTSTLNPTALPGVVNAVGVLARGRQLLVLDRVNGTTGAIHLLDASDPAQPQAQFSLVLPPFPRAFTLVPRYAYKRTLSGAAETNDVVVAAGGTLGGGGQWFRAFALPASGAPQPLIATTLSPSPAAAVTKFQWSAPLLGYLESDADTTAVGMLNLQLAILADHQTPAEFAANPVGGDPGVDANNDGDYVDTGDRLPRPDGSQPRLGVRNGGLVATYVAPDPVFRLRDFDLQFGGNFVGALLSAPPSDGRSRYTTLVAGGQLVTSLTATLELTPEGKRLFLLFGQQLDTLGGVIVANLALVSQHAGAGTPPRVLVLDVTDPLLPQVVNEIRIPVAHGIPQSIRRREDGLLVLSTSNDLLLLDPRKLRLVPATFAESHPALVGLVPGFGGGAMQFVSAPDGFAASAAGAGAKVAGPGSRVDLIVTYPGSRVASGPVVPEALEENPYTLLLFCNSDYDAISPLAPIILGSSDKEANLPPPPPPTPRDFEASVTPLHDNDLVTLSLRPPPRGQDGRPAHVVVLRIEAADDGRLPIRQSPIQFRRKDTGRVIPLDNGELRSTAGTPGSELYDTVVAGGAVLLAEGVRPLVGTKVIYEVFDDRGALIGKDTVVITTVDGKVSTMWSEQFPGSRSNFFPGNTGAKFKHYVLMANRDDDRTYVGVHVDLMPDDPEIRRRLQVRMVTATGHRVLGESSFDGTDYHVIADNLTGGFAPILLISPLLLETLDVSRRLAVVPVIGFDYDQDGNLGPGERSRILGGSRDEEREGGKRTVTFLLARMSGDDVVFNRAPKDNGIMEPHFKVVPRDLWAGQLAQAALLGTVSVLVAEFASGFQNVNPFGDDNFMAALHLEAFILGTMPASPFAPDRTGSFTVNDTVGGGNVGFPFTQGFDHNTGPFRPDGTRIVPYFRYSSRDLSSQVLNSAGLKTSLKEQLGKDLRHLSGATQGLGIGQSFRVTMPGGNGGRIAAGFNPAFEPDLFFGIGGTQFHDVEWSVLGIVRSIRANGHLTVTLRSAQIKARTQDLYDWELAVNPFATLISAGHGTYGNAGAAFVVEIPFDGTVQLDDIELDLP